METARNEQHDLESIVRHKSVLFFVLRNGNAKNVSAKGIQAHATSINAYSVYTQIDCVLIYYSRQWLMENICQIGCCYY